MFSTSILTFCLLSFVTADDVVNLINPNWARRGGNGTGNIAGSYAASVVGADATATTYVVGCKPNQTFTNTVTLSFASAPRTLTESHICATDTPAQLTFTQGPTSMHWDISSDIDGNVFTWTANYTFSKTLDPIVTATEFWVQGNPSGSYANTVVQASTSTELWSTNSYNATWYAIPITAGQEKLAAASATASITSAASLKSSTAAPTSTSTAGSPMVTARWIAAAAGGVAVLVL